MPNIRVRIGLRNVSDREILNKGETIYTSMDGNDDYKKSPVDRATLRMTLDQFSADVAARPQGGTRATVQKNITGEKLKSQIRRLGHPIQVVCDDDDERVRKAGFEVAGKNRAQKPLPKAVIVSVDWGLSGELVIRVRAVDNVKGYQVQSSQLINDHTPEPWLDDMALNSRAIRIRGLVPGTLYAVRVRALGGSTGSSDWSDPVTHRCR